MRNRLLILFCLFFLPVPAIAWIFQFAGIQYGPNLIANPTFDSGTPTFTLNGTNTVTNVSGEVVVAYVDTSGPRYYFETSGGNLSAAMTVGKQYLFEMDIYVAGDNITLAMDAGTSPAPANYTVDWTSPQKVSFTLTCQNVADDYWVVSNFGAGESFTIDNLSLREIL